LYCGLVIKKAVISIVGLTLIAVISIVTIGGHFYCWLTIYQDYYITVFMYNIISIASEEAQHIVDSVRKDKKNKYKYKANFNKAVGIFKDRFILALLEDDNVKKSNTVIEIIISMAKNLTPIRPNRSVERNKSPRKANFHYNQKSNC
jgi:hypothetical protein